MAAVSPAGPEPMIRTLASVRPSAGAAVAGPPASGAASDGASAIMLIPPPKGLRPVPADGAASPPPKLMLIEPKGLVAVSFAVLSSVMGELSVLSRGLSCPHCSMLAVYPQGVSTADRSREAVGPRTLAS